MSNMYRYVVCRPVICKLTRPDFREEKVPHASAHGTLSVGSSTHSLSTVTTLSSTLHAHTCRLGGLLRVGGRRGCEQSSIPAYRARATRFRAALCRRGGHNRIFGRCSELRGGAPVPCRGLPFFGGEVLGGESATLFERMLNVLEAAAAAAAPALARLSLLSGATRRTSFWRHSCERLASLCTASRNSSGTPEEG